MSAPGAEGIGGGSPEWRAPADQAPTSPGYEPDNPFVEDIVETAKLTARLPEELGGPTESAPAAIIVSPGGRVLPGVTLAMVLGPRSPEDAKRIRDAWEEADEAERLGRQNAAEGRRY